MSDDIKQKKEELLIKLLKANPQLSLKEANVSVREAFDTGVAPPMFSRIKKDLFAGQAEIVEEPISKTKEKPKDKPKAEKIEKVEKVAKTEKIEKAEKADKKILAKPKAKKAPKIVEEDIDLFDGSEAKKALAEEEKLKAKEAQPESLLSDAEEKPKKSKPKKKAKETEGSESAELSAPESTDSESKETSEPKKVKEEEPEIDPNLPKHIVKLVVNVPKASEVHLAGSFNRWKISELALQKSEGSQWTFEGELPEGTYEYKFVVDQKVWFLDMDVTRVTDKTGVSHRIVIPQTA